MKRTMPQSASELLDWLDASELRRKLDELDGERAAVLALLRCARARERAQRRSCAAGERSRETVNVET
jgi:hypothetical protein